MSLDFRHQHQLTKVTDRHPGLVENLDNPHPVDRRIPAVQSKPRPTSSKHASERAMSPR